MNGAFLPYPDKSRILYEIRQKYNVDFDLSVFDDNGLVYPEPKYVEECEKLTQDTFEYYGNFCTISNDNIETFTSIEGTDAEFDGYYLGLIIQAFFRKFRHDGFFSATFDGGVLIVSSENVKVIGHQEIIDEQRKLHEKLFKR